MRSSDKPSSSVATEANERKRMLACLRRLRNLRTPTATATSSAAPDAVKR